MTLILKDIFETTRQKFQLELIAGGGGLVSAMSWVYVAEDYTTSEFLRGGELIITTGMACRNCRTWLPQFLQHMADRRTCGLIVNTGKYICREDIPQEAVTFCEEQNFPLFLMPWKIHIYDVTRDYCNRIFSDTQQERDLSKAFLNLLNPSADHTESLALLPDYRFPEYGTYYMAEMIFSQAPSQEKADPTETVQPPDQLRGRLRVLLSELTLPSHLISHRGALILILCASSPSAAEAALTRIHEHLKEYTESSGFHMGVSGGIDSLHDLPAAYRQAHAALQMGRHKNETLCHYEDMGFFQLLLAIPDAGLLKEYVNARLGRIHEYDIKHQTDFARTLYLYLLYSGSIQAVAASSYCHRNTVNHRIHIIKDSLGYRLEDSRVRFELMSAFLTEEYLNSEIL